LSDLAELAADLGDGGLTPPKLHLSEADTLLVAEPADGGALLACLRVAPRLGLREPRYVYHVGCAVHAAADLGLFQRQATLTLGNDLTGSTELTDVLWARQHLSESQQQAVLFELIQAALVHLVRTHAQQTVEPEARQVVIELRGQRDAAGESPFWQGLGSPFCHQDVAGIKTRFGEAWHRHLAALLPKHAIYASFLPAATQAAIGRADARVLVLQQALIQAGFAHAQHVTIDDGGPIMAIHLDQLRPR
jgi:arginine N-succinyltransferase